MAEKAPTEDVREGEKNHLGNLEILHLRELEAVSKKKGEVQTKMVSGQQWAAILPCN